MRGLGKISFALAAFVLDLLPMRVRNCIADASGSVLYVLMPSWKHTIRENLSHTGADASNGAVLGILRNHTRNVLDMFASSRWRAAEIVNKFTFTGKEVLDEAIAGGRGAVAVTAHIGNWELAALYLSSLGYKLHVVAGIQLNRLLSEAVTEAKEKRGIQIVKPEHSYRRLFKALGSNGIVVLLVDGDVYREGSTVEFFGKAATLPKGAIQLAQRAAAPVIGGYCRRLPGGRYAIHIETVLSAAESASLPEEAALRRLYRHVELFIADNSDQWCILRRVWGA